MSIKKQDLKELFKKIDKKYIENIDNMKNFNVLINLSIDEIYILREILADWIFED